MTWFSTRRLASVGIAIGVIAASTNLAHGQILDRLRGRDTRTRIEEQPVERSYAAPYQGEVYRDRDGRVYRGGTEIRSGSEIRSGTDYRGDAGYRGDASYRGDGTHRSGGERITTRSASNARRATTLIGSSVRLGNGQSLGRIEDIVLSDSGCVDFMVVSVSGLRGMSGRLAVLPYSIGEPDFSRRVVQVDWTDEDLRRAPVFFSSSAWPDFTDEQWSEEVFAYFEVDSHDQHVGRAYRGARESDSDRYDEESSRGRDSRDRDSGQQDSRSYRGQDSRGRESTRERSSSDREQDRSRSDSRSRSRDMRDQGDDQSSERSYRSSDSRDRRSDSDRSRRTQQSDRSRSDESESDQDESNTNSSSRRSDSNQQEPPD